MGQYEEPKTRFMVKSIWDWELHRDGEIIDKWQEPNICVDEGLNKLLDVMFHAVTAVNPWYIAIFEDDVTPVAGTTYATPVYTECTAYTGTDRPIFNESAASSKSLSNTANKAEFTMNATKTIYGASLVSFITAGDTAEVGAVMYCASKFSASKAVVNLDVLKVTVTLTSSDIV